MNYIQNIFMLQDLHKEIQKGRTGGLMSLTRKMRLSTGTLRRKLEELREMGAKIEYDREAQTYYYKNNFNLEVKVNYED